MFSMSKEMLWFPGANFAGELERHLQIFSSLLFRCFLR